MPDTAFYKTKDGTYYASGKHPEGKKNQDEELQRVVSFVDAPWARNTDGNNDYRRLNYGWGNADGRS